MILHDVIPFMVFQVKTPICLNWLRGKVPISKETRKKAGPATSTDGQDTNIQNVKSNYQLSEHNNCKELICFVSPVLEAQLFAFYKF